MVNRRRFLRGTEKEMKEKNVSIYVSVGAKISTICARVQISMPFERAEP